MSSPQPSSAPRGRAEQAIRRAETSGGNGPVVDAIKAVHEDLAAEMSGIKADVEKLLHHFGLVSGGTP